MDIMIQLIGIGALVLFAYYVVILIKGDAR